MLKHYYSYNQYLRETFGARVHRLSLDAGLSCPNLDGKLSKFGCAFCNNRAFSYYSQKEKKPLKQQLKESILFCRKRYKAKKFIAYFQAFSNTYAEIKTLKQKYNQIKKHKDIVGIAVSTRPDCINKEKLKLLADFAKNYKVYIEYGLQSGHDDTLKKINRNHTFDAFSKAIKLSRPFKNIHLAAHIILGLPGETEKEMLATGKILSQMPLWGIKIHCLHVVKDTQFYRQYKEGRIKLYTQNQYLKILAKFIRVIPKNFVLLRLMPDANPSQLIAPGWINQKSKLLSKFDKLLSDKNIWQGDLLFAL